MVASEVVWPKNGTTKFDSTSIGIPIQENIFDWTCNKIKHLHRSSQASEWDTGRPVPAAAP